MDANRARDVRNDSELLAIGWVPVHVWEHEAVSTAADRIEELWRERVDR